MSSAAHTDSQGSNTRDPGDSRSPRASSEIGTDALPGPGAPADTSAACPHGYAPGECPEDGCLYRREVKNALLGLAGSVTAASDQAQAMTDRELGECLLGINGKRWTTIEIDEAGRRLRAR